MPHVREGALHRLFHPRSVAFYGASSDPRKIGGRPLDFIKSTHFDGALYPINPQYQEVQGLKAYPTAEAIEGPVDMAIVAVPAPHVLAALEDCARKKVGGAVVLSAGFAEVGGQGLEWQRQITELARRTGMRVVGPNCMGSINVRRGLLGTFTPSAAGFGLVPGRISLVSQSGAFGGYCLSLIRQRGIGLNLWVTTGNQSDVDFADCVRFYADDEETDVIVGYVEAVTDKQRLVEALTLARERGKRIVMMKVGSSEAGAHAAASHTASLAGSDQVYDGLFRQYGVYRARTIDELFDVAYACSLARKPPQGNRLGLLTVSGGVGALMADAAADHGMDVAPMPDEAQRRLKAIVPFAGPRNPVDMTAQLVNDVTLFEKNFNIMLEEGGYDIVVAFLSSVGQVPALSDELLQQLKKVLARFADRTIIISMLATPEVRKLYEAADAPPPLPAGALPAPTKALNEVEAKTVLASAGIPVVREVLAATEDAAAKAAAQLGYPVALKIASVDIPHKSEVGGVLLALADETQLREGWRTLMKRVAERAPGARLDGAVVAPMVKRGVETIIGVNRDPVFGPVVMFGLGGVFVEAFKDVAFRVAPIGVAQARAMIDEVRGRVLLTGLRGQPPADEIALAEAIARVSVFAARNAEHIDSIDINPFVVLPAGEGGVALDALIVPRHH
jgi:acyl-CoA synthetase (NDP forming)